MITEGRGTGRCVITTLREGWWWSLCDYHTEGRGAGGCVITTLREEELVAVCPVAARGGLRYLIVAFAGYLFIIFILK